MLDIGGAASRRTLVLGTPCSSACTARRRASYVHAQREDARACAAGERKRLHGGTPCLLLVCKLTKFFSNSRIFDEEFLAKPQGTQRKRSNISLGPALTLPTRPLQADACLRVHESDARAPFKTVHSPPFGGRGLGVGLYFIFHSSTVNLSMSKRMPTSTTRRPSVR